MQTCTRCEALPEVLPKKGKLYLSPAIASFAQNLKSYLDEMGLGFMESHPNIFEIQIDSDQLIKLCSRYLSRVGILELEDTKCLLIDSDDSIDIRMLAKMESLNTLLAKINGAWLINVLQSENLSVWFQPIVHTMNPTRIYAYECLSRGSSNEGELILADQMFQTARSADLLFNLDRLCRISAIRTASSHNVATNIFINFNPTAIYDPKFCLATTLRVITDLNMNPERIVFEVVESDRISDIEHLTGILKYFRNNGFRIAMDDVGAGYSSLNLLSQLRPDFIKLDMELIRNVDADPYKAIITSNMIQLARELGVQVIAEGVEREQEWLWLQEHGADFVQGHLFAKPAIDPTGFDMSNRFQH